MERFKKHQQYEKAYREMLSVDVVRNFLMYKTDNEQQSFNNHVGCLIYKITSTTKNSNTYKST